MLYQRPPDQPLFVICGSCGYLTIEPAPTHCKEAQDHNPEPVYLNTYALDELRNALGDGLADEGLGRNFDGGA